MRFHRHALTVAFALSLAILALPAGGMAQGRGQRARPAPSATRAADTLSLQVRLEIRNFYDARGATGATALPPGIRRNLARGKPLPPGIAKKSAPPELLAQVKVPDGYELVEVGLDVLLVEVATNLIHDVLMDVIR